MLTTRRQFVSLAGTVPFLGTPLTFTAQVTADESLRSGLRQTAGELGLPGLVAGVVRDGKLSFVEAHGFADLESRTPLRQDHIFYVASLTKTFTAVMLMQCVQEKKIALGDYVLDYPFLSVGFSVDRLRTPDIRLAHVLSHTSEGTPGNQNIYNGNRFNFLYGVFERVSGNTHHHQACAQEFRQRIEQPLGLTSTLAGYPTDVNDRRIPRIATPYFLDASHKVATRDKGASGGTTMYPATGLLSTVDDLAAYTIALDEHVLISADSYAHLTAPYTLNDGRVSAHGLGWSAQQIGGHAVNWAYGYGDSYSSLLVRVPRKKTSFILLSNTGAASAPFLLGFGNLLTSPFAVAFLDSVLPGVISNADRDFSRMFQAYYSERALGRTLGEASRLLGKLRAEDPDRFHRNDRALIHLLAELGDPAFSEQMDSLANAYRQTGDFHPEISLAIAEYYGKTGASSRREEVLRDIAEREGYGEARSTREACVALGTALLRRGRTAEGRAYLWKAAGYAKTAGANIESQERIVRSLKG
jgi:CubicO group peptidase (beta-lactamase class C family)